MTQFAVRSFSSVPCELQTLISFPFRISSLVFLLLLLLLLLLPEWGSNRGGQNGVGVSPGRPSHPAQSSGSACQVQVHACARQDSTHSQPRQSLRQGFITSPLCSFTTSRFMMWIQCMLVGMGIPLVSVPILADLGTEQLSYKVVGEIAGSAWLSEVIVCRCANYTGRIWRRYKISRDETAHNRCLQTWHLPWPPGFTPCSPPLYYLLECSSNLYGKYGPESAIKEWVSCRVEEDRPSELRKFCCIHCGMSGVDAYQSL